jgi:hypothetical protein
MLIAAASTWARSATVLLADQVGQLCMCDPPALGFGGIDGLALAFHGELVAERRA